MGTIVLDLNTLEVKAYIATPNGGDTHSGGFVRYTPQWKGELLADMGGPKAGMRTTMRERAAAAAPPAVATGGPVSGQMLFEKTAGGTGCATCHGANARGGGALNAPDIRGVAEDRIRGALAAVPAMSRIRLSDAELAAIVAHLAEAQ